MTPIELLSRIDKSIRPLMMKLPPDIVVPMYSKGRKFFLSRLEQDLPPKPYSPPEDQGLVLWDIHFATPVFNAAGMFKTGGGYEMVARQGAGAYLSGTTTSKPRNGNEKDSVLHPFATYPGSAAASNWMGLPNPGHETVAGNLSKIPRKKNCPIGASLSADPDLHGKESLQGIVSGMKLYEKAGVDFIELNESCPNVPHETSGEKDKIDELLVERLEYIKNSFLSQRSHRLPVIVKLSNDTDINLLPELLDLLIDMGFDGINLGNTSIEYDHHRDMIIDAEKKQFDYFTTTFGGGLSGRPLKEKSLKLASFAAEYVSKKQPADEFHVIRTGGIETIDDIIESRAAGISLCQWFSGYFESFARHGHGLYREMFGENKGTRLLGI